MGVAAGALALSRSRQRSLIARKSGVSALVFYLAAYAVTTLGSFGLVSWIGSREHERVLVDDWAGLAGRQAVRA